ncbi:hypothetical protein ACFL53_03780 [Pseudomonadota bacterium]
MQTLERFLFYVIPVFVFVIVVSFHCVSKIKYFQPSNSKLKRLGFDWNTIERLAVVSTVLSIWLVLSQNLISSIKTDEREKQEFISLVRVFEQTREADVITLAQIGEASERKFIGIQPLSLRDFSVGHIDGLLGNKNTSYCYELTTLFQIKSELNRLNLAMPYMRKLSGVSSGFDDTISNMWFVYGSDIIAKQLLELYSNADLDGGRNCLTSYST